MKYITNYIKVDDEASVEILDNGKDADQKVTLMRNDLPEGTEGPIFYLETNGDPVLLHQDNVVEASEDLGIEEAELRNLVPYLN